MILAYPAIFHQLSVDQVQAARQALGKPLPSRNHEEATQRVFNLDIAKLLLQCSALMYERTSHPLLDALEKTRNAFNPSGLDANSHHEKTAPPGQVLEDVVGERTARLVTDSLHQENEEEDEMTRFAARLGIKYATLSELNSQTSAFCGCFWDPNSNYIILAFKGTEPT